MKTVRLSLPWWGLPYAYSCAAFAWLHGTDADMQKITDRIARHIRVKVS